MPEQKKFEESERSTGGGDEGTPTKEHIMRAVGLALDEYAKAKRVAGGEVETKGVAAGMNVRVRRVQGALRIDVRGAEGPEFTSKKLPAAE